MQAQWDMERNSNKQTSFGSSLSMHLVHATVDPWTMQG